MTQPVDQKELYSYCPLAPSKKANHFKPTYFLATIAISGIVGAAAGILADTEWQVSFFGRLRRN